MTTLLSLWTVLVLIVFLGIVIWACNDKNKAAFDAAARIPIDDDEQDPGSSEEDRNG